MRATTLIAALALTGGIFAAGATLAPTFAQNAPAAAATQSNWMSVQGLQSKLDVDPVTGDILKTEVKRKK